MKKVVHSVVAFIMSLAFSFVSFVLLGIATFVLGRVLEELGGRF